MWAADGQESVPHREWLIMFDRVVKEVKAEMEQKGRGGEFIGAKVFIYRSTLLVLLNQDTKIIYTTIRFLTPAELEWYLEDCIALKKEFPHIIAGMMNSKHRLRSHSHNSSPQDLTWSEMRLSCVPWYTMLSRC